jgi:methyl-accepting chemotaxis protein
MARRTGEVIVQLVDASRSLAAAATDLLDSSTHQARSANEQATSVAQMGATVAELRQTFSEATSKTAKGIAQLESAAGNMKGLSTRLTEVVGRYKV